MLNFGNKEFRNLQEQVQKNAEDIQKFNYGGAVLAEFGIRVIGRVDSEEELPDTSLFTEDDAGDAYAVGEEDNPPYELYVLTRPFIEGDPLQWFYIGRFPEPGPQGPAGAQGEPGAQGSRGTGTFAGAGAPASISGFINGDIYIDSTAGGLYRFSGTIWTYIGSLRGPQGPQGIQGEQGPKGDKGDTGDMGPQGDPGTSYIIMGRVNNIEALPQDLNEVPDGAAYLVGTVVPYTLYVLSASTPRQWINTGAFNDAYNVSIVDLEGTSGVLNPTDFTTLTSSVQAMIKLNNEDIFRLNNQTNDVLVYNMLDRYNVQKPTEKYIIVTKFSGAWSLASEDLLVPSSLNDYYTKTAADAAFQEKLINTQNIKSINNQSLLGSGNIEVVTDLTGYATIDQLNTVSAEKQDNIDANNKLSVNYISGLATVATSGSYNDLSNKPTIPVVSYPVTDVQVDGTSVLDGTVAKITLPNAAVWGNITGILSNQTDLENRFSKYMNLTTGNILGGNGYIESANGVFLADTAVGRGFNSGSKVGAITGFSQTSGGSTVWYPTLQFTNGDNFKVKLTYDYITNASSGDYTLKLPNKSGTLATLADITGGAVSWNDITGKPTFATVATSGSYNDLSNKPTLFSGDYNDLSNKPTLFSGDYDDLTDKPTIPTNTNQLTNGAGFITSAALAGYAQSSEIPTAVSDLSNDSDFQTETEVQGLISSALSGYATEQYVDDAISGLGNVFNIKGSVANVASLPASGNTIGDVYYVASEQAGYVWIEINNVPQWEELGPSIDLSNYALKSELPTATSDLTNDSGFITSSALNGYALTPDIPTNNNQLTNGAGYITSSALSGYALSSSLATVATSGSYNDLSNKPNLATVATSGSYNDLSNKPTIPTPVVADEKTIVTNSLTGELETAIGGWKEESAPIPGSTVTGTTQMSSNPPTSGYNILQFNSALGISMNDIIGGTGAFSGNIILNDGKDTALDIYPYNGGWGVFQVSSNLATALQNAGISDKDYSQNCVRANTELSGSIYFVFDSNNESSIIAVAINNNQSAYDTQCSATLTYQTPSTPGAVTYHPIDAEFVKINQRSSSNIGGLYIDSYHTLNCDAVGYGELLNMNYASQTYVQTAIADKQDASTAYNTSNIVYSATQPSSPVAGMIWLKPVN